MRLVAPRLFENTTVRVVRTPADECVTCSSEASLSEIQKICEEHGFDMIPVLKESRVIGTVWRSDIETGSHEDENVGPHLRDRSGTTVERDTPLVNVIGRLAETRALAVEHEGEFDGVVTYADLNKRSFRVLIYAFLAELEVQLGELLRSEINDGSAFVEQYSDELRASSIGAWIKSVHDGVELHPVQRMYLSEMVKIISKDRDLRVQLGFSSRNDAEDYLGGLMDLRNDVMHPVRSLVRSPEDVSQLDRRTKRLIDLLEGPLDAIEVNFEPGVSSSLG